MLADKVLEHLEKSSAVAKEPIFVNMNNYPVLVATPEGRYINLPGNCRAAVVGPGFENYVEKRILMLAGADYKGPIIYATPLVRKVFPVPASEPPERPYEDLVRPLTENEIQSFGIAHASLAVSPPVEESPVEEVLSFGPATADGSPLPTPIETPAKAVQEARPAPKSKQGIPTGAPSLPPRRRLQVMKHKDLMEVARKLGMKPEGSRTQLLTRLLPLAKE